MMFMRSFSVAQLPGSRHSDEKRRAAGLNGRPSYRLLSLLGRKAYLQKDTSPYLS